MERVEGAAPGWADVVDVALLAGLLDLLDLLGFGMVVIRRSNKTRTCTTKK